MAINTHGWRSSLYPEDWSPPEESVFNEDLFLQDFSYAGYRYNEVPLPWVDGPQFNVLDYGADPTGSRDSTQEIQDAIDACAAAGGGLVFLPEGTYRVAPPDGEDTALKISHSRVILRGEGADRTRILNTSFEMRNKFVIQVSNKAYSWLNATSTRRPLTADILGPVTRIPVSTTSGLRVGDEIVIHAEATPEWIEEHKMDSDSYWLGKGSTLGGVAFFREIVAIDPGASELVIDTPVRYALKRRDNAAVFKTREQLAEIGLEHFSIGNVEHPGASGWTENDWNDASKSAYDTHGSWLIRYLNVRHGWIRGVHSFGHEDNPRGSHMLSNGILVRNSRNITVRDCDMQKIQYGGGGGNGYTYRIQNSQEVLLVDSAARYQRHGFVQSHMRNSGNVLHRVLSQETKRQTAGSGSTNGAGSDHHMHFSQSMLFDMAQADRDIYDAHWRSTWGTVAHGLTSTKTVFWNTKGIRKHPSRSHLVRSDQYGFGYVIGTSGSNDVVNTSRSTFRTEPEDFVEGVGIGDTLEPASLYRDQMLRRTGLILADPVASLQDGLLTFHTGAAAESVLSASVDWGSDNADGRVVHWRQISGPVANIRDKNNLDTFVHLPEPGQYEFECLIDNGWYSTRFNQTVELVESGPSPYTEWANSAFGPGTVADMDKETTIWGIEADPDKDRIPNAIEYATGSDPLAPSPSPLRHERPNVVVYDCSMQSPLPELEISQDGSVWEPVSAEHLQIISVHDGRMSVQFSIPENHSASFLRLKVVN